MISKNHRSVRIFVPVNRVRRGPLKGIRGSWITIQYTIILIFYFVYGVIESSLICLMDLSHESIYLSLMNESQDLNLNLVRIPGN